MAMVGPIIPQAWMLIFHFVVMTVIAKVTTA
jgi:hypothetical protein